jgi:hypothetical protein
MEPDHSEKYGGSVQGEVKKRQKEKGKRRKEKVKNQKKFYG